MGQGNVAEYQENVCLFLKVKECKGVFPYPRRGIPVISPRCLLTFGQLVVTGESCQAAGSLGTTSFSSHSLPPSTSLLPFSSFLPPSFPNDPFEKQFFVSVIQLPLVFLRLLWSYLSPDPRWWMATTGPVEASPSTHYIFIATPRTRETERGRGRARGRGRGSGRDYGSNY